MDPNTKQTDSGNRAEQQVVQPVQEQPAKQLSNEAMDMLQQQWSMKQQLDRVAKPQALNPVSLVGDAGYSAIRTGIQDPIVGLTQFVSPQLSKNLEILPKPNPADFGSAKWHAQVIGDGAGMILPFMATRQGMKKAGLSMVAKEEALMAAGKLGQISKSAVIADSALTGFAYDFLTRPVDMNKNDFWTARTKNGAVGALTFGTLGAASTGLRASSREMAMKLTGAEKVAYNMGIGAISGIPAGIVNADSEALLTKGRLATGEERVEGAYGMLVAGGTLGAFHKVGKSEGAAKTVAGEGERTANGDTQSLNGGEKQSNRGPVEQTKAPSTVERSGAGDVITGSENKPDRTSWADSLPKFGEDLDKIKYKSFSDGFGGHEEAHNRSGQKTIHGADLERILQHSIPITAETRAEASRLAESSVDSQTTSGTEFGGKIETAGINNQPKHQVSDAITVKAAEVEVQERPELNELPRAIDPSETVSMRELVERNDPQVDKLMADYYPKLEKAFPLEGEIESTDTYKEYLGDKDGTWDMVLLRDAEQKIIGGIQFQVIDAQGDKLKKVAWVEHIWVEEENRTFPNFKSLLKIAADRTKAAGADMVFMEFNNPDKMTLEQMAEDAEGGITTQDRETLWGSVGIHVAVDSKGNIAEYGQPSMDGQPSVEYLSLGFIGNENLTGEKLPISDYLALARAAHSTIPGCDLATDPTVVNYTKACQSINEGSFTLKPLAEISKVRRTEAKLKSQDKKGQ